MKRYLLDTGIMGHLLNRRRGVDSRVSEARRNGTMIGTCMPVVGELFFGVEASANREPNRKRLVRGLSRILCWPFTRQAAELYGEIAAELKHRGRPIQQIDIQIAAIALSLGKCTVVSTDGDLATIAGLDVETGRPDSCRCFATGPVNEASSPTAPTPPAIPPAQHRTPCSRRWRRCPERQRSDTSHQGRSSLRFRVFVFSRFRDWC
jgi:tRNA(fMet)-specific endonuclease VapC